MGNVTNRSDSMDDLLGLLRDRRRRFVIYYLRDHAESEPVGIDTLAAAIAAMEIGGELPWRGGETTAGTETHLEAGKDERTRAARVRISLVHTHLPKLHEGGIIEFDRLDGTVRASNPPDEFWDGVQGCQRFNAELAGTKAEH